MSQKAQELQDVRRSVRNGARRSEGTATPTTNQCTNVAFGSTGYDEIVYVSLDGRAVNTRVEDSQPEVTFLVSDSKQARRVVLQREEPEMGPTRV